MSQTFGTSPFPASALELKPEDFAVNASEVRLIVNGYSLASSSHWELFLRYGPLWHD